MTVLHREVITYLGSARNSVDDVFSVRVPAAAEEVEYVEAIETALSNWRVAPSDTSFRSLRVLLLVESDTPHLPPSQLIVTTRHGGCTEEHMGRCGAPCAEYDVSVLWTREKIYTAKDLALATYVSSEAG